MAFYPVTINHMSNSELATKTFLKNGHGKKSVQKVIEGKTKPVQVGQNVLEEAKMLLLQKGFTIDSILNKYIEIVKKKDVTFRGSDVVSVLDRLSAIQGLEIKTADQSNDNVSRRLQNAPINDIKVFMIQISKDTERYIKALENVEEQ